MVGVNEFVTDQIDDVEILRVDPEAERQQVDRLKTFKAERDQELGRAAARGPAPGRQGHGNLLEPIRAALKDRCTIGEVSGVMREEFGEYSEA